MVVDKSVGRSKLVVVEGRGFLDSVLRAAMGSVVMEDRDEMGLSLGGGAVLLLGDALALVGIGLTM